MHLRSSICLCSGYAPSSFLVCSVFCVFFQVSINLHIPSHPFSCLVSTCVLSKLSRQRDVLQVRLLRKIAHIIKSNGRFSHLSTVPVGITDEDTPGTRRTSRRRLLHMYVGDTVHAILYLDTSHHGIEIKRRRFQGICYLTYFCLMRHDHPHPAISCHAARQTLL